MCDRARSRAGMSVSTPRAGCECERERGRARAGHPPPSPARRKRGALSPCGQPPPPRGRLQHRAEGGLPPAARFPRSWQAQAGRRRPCLPRPQRLPGFRRAPATKRRSPRVSTARWRPGSPVDGELGGERKQRLKNKHQGAAFMLVLCCSRSHEEQAGWRQSQVEPALHKRRNARPEASGARLSDKRPMCRAHTRLQVHIWHTLGACACTCMCVLRVCAYT